MFCFKKNLISKAYSKLKTINQVVEKNFDFEKNPQRSKLKICVIDDEGFSKKTYLYNLGYTEIEERYSFDSIDSFKDFDVILCDMDGIGKMIDEKKQGLAVAEQLSINYPLKRIFIYSGKSLEEYGHLPVNVGYISKQLSANELTKYFDQNCSYFWNPVESWKKIYDLMIKSGMPAKTIAVIEDRYVTSILEKNNLFDSEKNYYLPDFQSFIGILSVCAKFVTICLEAINNA